MGKFFKKIKKEIFTWLDWSISLLPPLSAGQKIRNFYWKKRLGIKGHIIVFPLVRFYCLERLHIGGGVILITE